MEGWKAGFWPFTVPPQQAAIGQKEPVGCLQEIRGDSEERKTFQSKFPDYVKW